MKIVVYALCVAFGIARLAMNVKSEVHREDLFKDFAHLFQGGLYGASIFATVLRRALRKHTPWYDVEKAFIMTWEDHLWLLAIGMTVLEIIAFKLHQ